MSKGRRRHGTETCKDKNMLYNVPHEPFVVSKLRDGAGKASRTAFLGSQI